MDLDMPPFSPTGSADDALAHAQFATKLLEHARTLPPGSVIAIQGAWGRGKTDVLSRAYGRAQQEAQSRQGPIPLWINPWQYGTPDLISPLVVELINRIPRDKRASENLRRVAQTLLRAGNAMLFKAVSVVAPLGSILEAGAAPVDSLIQDLFATHSGQDSFDPDPVAAMGSRFRELVDEYVSSYHDSDGRLLICIDDLDRCLPDHQIAMLEAIYFLTGARAKADFFIALDPTLVQQAAITHYRTTNFDTNQYLDKLFDLRVTLRTLSRLDAEELIALQLDRPVEGGESLSLR